MAYSALSGGSDFTQEAAAERPFASALSGVQTPQAPNPTAPDLATDMANLFSQGMTMGQQRGPDWNRFRQMEAFSGIQAEMSKSPIDGAKIAYDTKTGKVSISEMSADAVQGIQRDLAQLNQLRGAFAQEAARLQAKEDYQRKHPVMQLLTTLGANLGSAPNMPGWVQGLAKTSAQLNPTADELQQRRMGLMKEQAGLASHSAQMSGELERQRMERERVGLERQRMDNLSVERQQNNVEQVRNKANERARLLGKPPDRAEFYREMSKLNVSAADTEAAWRDVETTANQAAEEKRLAKVDAALKEASSVLGKGVGRLDEKAVQARLQKAGATPEEIDAGMGLLRMESRNISEKHHDEQKNREQKATDKSMEDAMLQDVAKAITSKDPNQLTSMRSITSMRGDQRLKLFYYARQIDPTFSQAKVERQIKTMDSFFTAQGKDQKDIQSFDTFLQHGGEVVGAAQKLYLSNNKYVNKSLNWWRKNMSGSPEYQAFKTAIEPVGKEYASFLLGGKALYRDDREAVNAILNSELPMGQILAAAKQMGITALDRYSALEHKFSRDMGGGVSLMDVGEDPFSPKARAGARKMGVALPEPKGQAGDAPASPTPPPGAKVKSFKDYL